MFHGLGEADGFSLVRLYLSAEIGVQPYQVVNGRMIGSSFEGVWHLLTYRVWISRQVATLGIQILWRLRHNTAGSDILAADKPQPIEPLFVRELDVLTPLASLRPQRAFLTLISLGEHTPKSSVEQQKARYVAHVVTVPPG